VGARGVDPDHRWLDWRIVEWVASHAVRPAADPRSRPTAHSRDATPAL